MRAAADALEAELMGASRLSARKNYRRALTSLFFRLHLEQARRLRVGQSRAAEERSQEKSNTRRHTDADGRQQRIGENRRDAQ